MLQVCAFWSIAQEAISKVKKNKLMVSLFILALQNARELCTLLIRDIYGDVSSVSFTSALFRGFPFFIPTFNKWRRGKTKTRTKLTNTNKIKLQKVVDVLLEYGRMPIPHLVRKVKLPEKIVRQTLVVLIQQHLVRFYTHFDGGSDMVYYECDWMQIYELLHAGKIIRVVEDRFGADVCGTVREKSYWIKAWHMLWCWFKTHRVHLLLVIFCSSVMQKSATSSQRMEYRPSQNQYRMVCPTV